MMMRHFFIYSTVIRAERQFAFLDCAGRSASRHSHRTATGPAAARAITEPRRKLSHTPAESGVLRLGQPRSACPGDGGGNEMRPLCFGRGLTDLRCQLSRGYRPIIAQLQAGLPSSYSA